MTLSYKFVSFVHARWAVLCISPFIKEFQKCHTSVEQGWSPVVQCTHFRGAWLSWCLVCSSRWLPPWEVIRQPWELMESLRNCSWCLLRWNIWVKGKQHTHKNTGPIGWVLLGKNIEKIHSWGLDNFDLNCMDPLICILYPPLIQPDLSICRFNQLQLEYIIFHPWLGICTWGSESSEVVGSRTWWYKVSSTDMLPGLVFK